METNATFRRAGFFALGALALLLVVSKPADAQILSTQISTAPQLTSSQYVNIPGLFLTLPPKSATQTYALIILNVPAPYASGSDFPGVTFAINVMGSLVAEGGFTYSQKIPQSFGRMPTTLVVRVPLTVTYQTVWGQWVSVRNSVGRIDSFASLSAIVGN